MMVAEGILTARGGLVSHAAVVARGWGTPGRRRRRGGQDRAASQFTVGDVVVQRGRRHLARRLHRRGRARRDGARRPPSRRRSSTRSSAGPTTIRKGKLGVRANADTGEDAANARQSRRRGHRPVPHRAHVPRPGPPAGRAPHDPRRHARARRPPRSRSCATSSRPTSRRSSRRWTACRSRCACSTRRCTSSCRRVEELRDQGGHRRASTRRGAEAARRRPRAGHELNPMLGTRGVRLGVVKPGLYAMQVRALMEAAAELRDAGQEPDRRDHDPAHRHPRGAARWPAAGSRRRSTRRTKGLKQASPTSRSAR